VTNAPVRGSCAPFALSICMGETTMFGARVSSHSVRPSGPHCANECLEAAPFASLEPGEGIDRDIGEFWPGLPGPILLRPAPS